MRPIDLELNDWLAERVAGMWPELGASADCAVRPTGDPRFGDYQSNVAMSLAKPLRRPPRAIAEAIVKDLPRHRAIERVEIAGPGFINLFLASEWMLEAIRALLARPEQRIAPAARPERVLIDFSSPNVAKPMHIGHLRSTILGESLRRILIALGHEVLGDNHLGDWGTQFGLLTVGYRRFLDGANYGADPVEELERVYVRAYEAAQADPGLMDEARRELVRLQQGDPRNRQLWQAFVQASRGEFDRIYQRLNIHFDLVRGESAYEEMLPGLIDELVARGLARESDGALVVFFPGDKLPPLIVRKQDGGFNYATTDLATIKYRAEELRAERVIYVTDERQQLHFRQVFEVARQMGFTLPLEHVWFGLMRLPEGTFSTRQGNVIKLERLLDEAERRAAAVLDQTGAQFTEAERREISRVVGLGAVKYADLAQHRQTLVTFDWDRMLALDGNTAPYLQYTYARIRSIWRKHAEQGGAPMEAEAALATPFEPGPEQDLAKALLRFSETVHRAGRSYRPNVIADYLFELGQLYNALYQNLPVLRAEPPARARRLLLCEAVARTIRHGLDLLGIEVVERM